MPELKTGRGALATGALAALLASSCCLGPLILVTLGFSGAWIGSLRVLEPYRPLFIGAAVLALFFAWRSAYRPARACAPGDLCALPRVGRTYRLVLWIVTALAIVALGFPYVLPLLY